MEMRSHSRGPVGLPSLDTDFSRSDLGDQRRNERAVWLARRVQSGPSLSLPKVFRDPSELEAVYRFLANPHVSSQALVSGHVAATAERASTCERVIVVHDSSQLRYFGEREGLGWFQNGQGLLFHASLAVAEKSRMPLGLLGFQTLLPKEPKAGSTQAQRKLDARKVARADKLSMRWDRGVEQSAAAAAGTALLHVADQEADQFAFFAWMKEHDHRFVIRGRPDRVVTGRSGETVGEKLESAPSYLEREVPLSARPAKQRGRTAARNNGQPVRAARTARLSIRAETVQLGRPGYAQTESRELALNAVYVREVEPPEGEEPVTWLLYTTEPIDTAEQIAAVVDAYRCRWMIEEYFKALKTGCAIEKRQLVTEAGLERALAIYAALAWRLLLLRHLARTAGGEPADKLFDPVELAVIRELAEGAKLGPRPSLEEVYFAIANIGGHIRRNGPPGWKTLADGYEELLKATRVVNAINHRRGSDQS